MNVLLIVYDNESHIPFFPQGIAYISAALKEQGHYVKIWAQDIHHYPDDLLTMYLDTQHFDVVGLGFVAGYYQFNKCLGIAKAVNRSRNRKNFKFVLGGHGPAAAPEYFRNKFEADIICNGEGESFFIWENHHSGNTAFPKPDDKICIRNMAPIEDVDLIPTPDYAAFSMDIYRLIRWPTSTETDFCFPILSGRGCPYKCTFCFRMTPGDFRPRSPESVVDEIRQLNFFYDINHFQFSDELFMSSRERIGDFCEHLLLLKHEIPGFKWDCNGRLNFAQDDVLELMKEAGCEYINYGIEALDDNVLKNIKKGLTVNQIESGVEATLRAGLVPGLNIMWGNRGDSVASLKKATDFLIKYDTCRELRTIRPVTPYPGSPLFDYAVEQGLLDGPADFYENKHVNSDLLTVNFTDLPDSIFHAQLFQTNIRLFNNYMQKNRHRIMLETASFYQGKNKNFRGFRPI